MTADVLALEPWTAELLRLCKADAALNRHPDEDECVEMFRAGHTPGQAHEVFARVDQDEGNYE